MIKIDKLQKALIKSTLNTEGYDVMIKVLGNKIETLNAEPITGNTEFETLRSLHIKQGKVDGLKEFFDELEKLAFE